MNAAPSPSATTPTTIRDLTRRLEALDREKWNLPYDHLAVQGKRGNYSSYDFALAEKATALRKKAILGEMRALREQRKALQAAIREDRTRRAASVKAERAAKRAEVTAECQICENHQCLDRQGRLVLHGYQRPGDGYILGRCYGVGHLPYPAIDALAVYVKLVEGQASAVERAILALPERTEIVRAPRWLGDSSVTFRKGECTEAEWQREFERVLTALAREKRALVAEGKRATTRIRTAGARLE